MDDKGFIRWWLELPRDEKFKSLIPFSIIGCLGLFAFGLGLWCLGIMDGLLRLVSR